VQITDLQDRLEFVTDPEAEPVDFDAVLARYLLTVVRSEALADPAASAESDSKSEVNDGESSKH